METKLRIILDGYQTAAFNMAADLYLLKECIHSSCIYIRFYHWKQPTITIGYNQIPEKLLDLKKIALAHATWIRRPTGGRAVLHHGDITYSCVFSKHIKEMGTSISETYTIISDCLKRGLENSGIICSTYTSSLLSEKFSRVSKLPCFLAPNRKEIMINDKKLVGSAQKRTAEAVLQHGSIPVDSSFRKLPLYQKMDSLTCAQQIELLHKKCTCIKENIEEFTLQNIIDNLIQGFLDVLSLPAELKNWSNKEKEEILTSTVEKRFIEKWLQ